MSAEISLTTWYPAAPEMVWRWWTEAERLARWFAPTGSRVLSAVADSIPDGAWQVVFAGPGGRVNEHGRYLDLSPPHGLRMSLQQRFDSGAEGPQTEITVTFAAEAGGTRLHFLQRGVDAAAVTGMTEGWESCLAQIGAGLASDAAPRRAVV
jgi:uncharacterized protein YndB with AHSA1/START domain